ncbi:DUF7662 domain-containing protein [Ureibacillus endophyticus]|uniref:DUF7662 domain-containing protein n=1 Tax=Ureibacillus endophyticus TaxID=1978490 RepID=A0A494YT84_9BACL|nr:hypothetical protein [Lysinibacillus endophyticus]RKQ13332.1 hypothetical protein D8M03_16260 [Lysinibacillus endophyticus]
MSRLKAGRYVLLQHYLMNVSANEIKLSFSEIESIIKESLPASAYKYPAWWGNTERSQKHAVTWLHAGYKIKEINFGNYVIFIKAEVVESKVSFKVDHSNQAKVVENTEASYIEKISNKLMEAQAFLNNEEVDAFSKIEVIEQFELLKGLRRILGNVDNDMSFLGCLLIKEFLQSRHDFPELNMALKAQGSPGLDIDEMTVDGKRVIGELKTTYPYKENDLGAQQKNSFLKDFDKLQRNDAEYKYFFLTEQHTFDIVCAKYLNHLQGVYIVLLPDAIEDSKWINSV